MMPSITKLRSLLGWFTLALIVKPSYQQNQLCGCQPGVYTISFYFNGTCDFNTVEGKLGINETTCNIAAKGGNDNVTDLVPDVITLVQVYELDQNQDPLSTNSYTDPIRNGGNITYTSIMITDPESIAQGSFPRGIQISGDFLNANEEPISFLIAITYDNDCTVFPLLEVGDGIGLAVMADLGDPPQEFCPIVNATQTPTIAPTAVPLSPPVGPTLPPVTPTSIPATPTSIPVTPTSIPVTPTSIPVTPTSIPVTPTSIPVTPTSIPATPTSIPVTPTSPPVLTTVPASASPSSTPVAPTPVPLTPPASPTATPASPTAVPVVPVSPTMAPVSMTEQPVTMAPVQSTPSMTDKPVTMAPMTDKPVSAPTCVPLPKGKGMGKGGKGKGGHKDEHGANGHTGSSLKGSTSKSGKDGKNGKDAKVGKNGKDGKSGKQSSEKKLVKEEDDKKKQRYYGTDGSREKIVKPGSRRLGTGPKPSYCPDGEMETPPKAPKGGSTGASEKTSPKAPKGGNTGASEDYGHKPKSGRSRLF